MKTTLSGYIYPNKELAAYHPKLRKTNSIWEEVHTGTYRASIVETDETGHHTTLYTNNNLPSAAAAAKWVKQRMKQ